MKTILITGGTGFLGGSLVRRLARKDYRLILLVRNKGKLGGGGLGRLLAEEDGKVPAHSARIELLEGDVTRPLLGLESKVFLRLAGEVDTVFHCAALTDFDDRDALLRTNFVGTKEVLDFAVAQRPKRYHHISSAFVSGKSNPQWNNATRKGRYNNAYEESKLVGEVLVRKYTSLYRLPAAIYRPSMIIGSSKNGYTKCFKGMYSFAKALYLISKTSEYARGESFRMFGLIDAGINLVPMDYVADSIMAISGDDDDEGSIGKTFNVINPNPPSLQQLKVLLVRTMGIRDPEIVPLTDQTTLNSLERLYLSYTRPYLPYVHNKYKFYSSNTRELLMEKDIICPRIDRRLVSLLTDFAIRKNWGDDTEQKKPVLGGLN